MCIRRSVDSLCDRVEWDTADGEEDSLGKDQNLFLSIQLRREAHPAGPTLAQPLYA